jgi:hemerythrin superfamily protein
MDVFEFLSHEHDAVQQLFKQLEEAQGEQASRLFRRLSDMLALHEKLEESLFYPRLREDERAKEIVLEAYQEHHVLDLLLEEISRLDPSREEWQPKLKVLQENTDHHIEEEEKELFPAVRKIWDKPRREEVGREMQAMKQKETGGRRAA